MNVGPIHNHNHFVVVCKCKCPFRYKKWESEHTTNRSWRQKSCSYITRQLTTVHHFPYKVEVFKWTFFWDWSLLVGGLQHSEFLGTWKCVWRKSQNPVLTWSLWEFSMNLYMQDFSCLGPVPLENAFGALCILPPHSHVEPHMSRNLGAHSPK